jgi:hypothetical protein
VENEDQIATLKNDVTRAQRVLDAMPPKPIRRLDAAWHAVHRPAYYSVVVEKRNQRKVMPNEPGEDHAD